MKFSLSSKNNNNDNNNNFIYFRTVANSAVLIYKGPSINGPRGLKPLLAPGPGLALGGTGFDRLLAIIESRTKAYNSVIVYLSGKSTAFNIVVLQSR